MRFMHTIAILLIPISALLAGFAWWGISTAAGRARFDEMDGIYPWLAGALSIVLCLTAVALWLMARSAK